LLGLAIKRFLKLSRYSVEVAYDGLEALSKMDAFQPDCVLLDIRMPNLDGIAVLKEIKTTPSSIVVIMTTAVTNEETARECISIGAFDYIIKPIRFKDLGEKIKTALEYRSAPET